MDLPPPHDCIHRLERGVARPPSAFSEDSTRHPLTVHWSEPGDALVAHSVLAATEHAWDVLVDQIGFRAPVPDAIDGPNVDLYLVEQDPLYAWTAADTWIDSNLGDGFASTPAYAVFSRSIPAEAIDAYTAHEFSHLTQWSTDYTEPTLPIWEGTATAAQKWVLGPAGAWHLDIPSFQRFPGAPTLLTDGYQLEPLDPFSTFEYGSALWVMALDELAGGGGQGAVALWNATANEGLVNEPDVVDAVAASLGSLAEALDHIAEARLLIGPDWDPRGLEDAAHWDETFSVQVEPLQPEWAPENLFITGQAFASFTAPSEGTLSIAIESDHEISLIALSWPASGPVTHRGSAATAVSLEPGERAVLALSNLGPPGWDGDDDPWVRADPLVHWSFDPTPPPIEDEPIGGCACQSAAPRSLFPLLFRRRGRAHPR